MKTKLEQYHFSSQLLVIRSCSGEPGITKWMPLFHIWILKEVSKGVSQRYLQNSVSQLSLLKMFGEIFDVKTEEVLSSVQFSPSVTSDSLRPHESQLSRPPCPSPTPGVHPNSCSSSQWCHLTISSSVVHFSGPQSLLASESFPGSQLFTWGGQSFGVSASASVLPINTQDWSPSEWTGWISLQSKGVSRVFSNTTAQKHQFFCAQLKIRQWQPTPVLLPGESQGKGSLVGCCPWGRTELEMTEAT